MVVERFVFCWRKAVKFFGKFNIEYADMSNDNLYILKI